MIALMQEDTRIDRDEGGKNLSIGYYIMKVSRVETFRSVKAQKSDSIFQYPGGSKC